jgi:hypothetical protein
MVDCCCTPARPAEDVRREKLTDAAVDAAVEALRGFHLSQLGYDPTDPELLRRTATIALAAGLQVIWAAQSDGGGHER